MTHLDSPAFRVFEIAPYQTFLKQHFHRHAIMSVLITTYTRANAVIVFTGSPGGVKLNAV